MDLDSSISVFKKTICASLDIFQKEVKEKAIIVQQSLEEITEKEYNIAQINESISTKQTYLNENKKYSEDFQKASFIRNLDEQITNKQLLLDESDQRYSTLSSSCYKLTNELAILQSNHNLLKLELERLKNINSDITSKYNNYIDKDVDTKVDSTLVTKVVLEERECNDNKDEGIDGELDESVKEEELEVVLKEEDVKEELEVVLKEEELEVVLKEEDVKEEDVKEEELEEDVKEEELEEEDELEVEEITYKKKKYYSDGKNVYAIVDDDIGDIIGNIKSGKVRIFK